jgi:hypothetical protein
MPNENNASEVERAHTSDELGELAASFNGSIRRRLILWVVRWTFGFAAIAVAVQWRPRLAWLWWAGAIIAFVSLLTLIALHVVARRRVELARERVSEYETFVRSIKHDPSDGFPPPRE